MADSYGIELVHPLRQGRSPTQVGKKGKSNHRWIVGGKFGFVLNHLGQVSGWACVPANVHDSAFQPLVARFQEQRVVLVDSHFHAKAGDPPNMKVCKRGTWNERMLVETVLSMLTRICRCKQMSHRVWAYFQARLAFLVVAFNLLVGWQGLQADEQGFVRLSIVEFSL